MRQIRTTFTWLAMLLVLASLSGCERETIVGTYSATLFTYTPPGGTPQNVLAAGGSISLIIYNDLTTSGNLSVPASVTGGQQVSASLIGQAVQLSDVVTLNLIVETFLRDAQWTFDGNTLSTIHVASGVTAVIELTKAD
jgi:hypothetical protein